MDSAGPAIEAEHLSKFYGQVLGLNDLSLTVRTGEVRGLLGQNGSGKSTLLKSLLGLIHPSSGHVRVLGVDVQKAPMEIRRLVGYVPRSQRLSVIVSQSYKTAAFSRKAPHKNCEKRPVFPIPGSKTSFSN